MPANVLACMAGVLIGTLIGVLPGIGPVGTIALLLPFSFSLDATASLILFTGIYYGSMYGGSTTSILLNLPGEAASVVTCIDGHAMARKGRAGAALAVAAVGSFIAGTIGVIGLSFFAPVLAQFALNFGPAEYFAIALLGIIILVKLTGRSMLKSALMVVSGIMIGTVGLDTLTGISRFTLEIDELQRGIEFSVVAMGLFGVSEVLETLTQVHKPVHIKPVKLSELYPSKEEWQRSIAPIFRGGVIGFLVGLLPGPASIISTLISYAAEKKLSKRPEEFGHGAIEGVAGPESANNAAASATMIPLLSLGLPFAATSAILLSGFMMHGIIPGPNLIQDYPELFWGLIVSMYIANLLLLIINFPLVGFFAYLLRTPIHYLMPIVLILTILGTYSMNNSLFDIILLLVFGVLGFLMKKTGYEPAPLVIGLILGPIMERGLTQSLILSNGQIGALFMRPISGMILWLGILLLLYQVIRWSRKKWANKRLPVKEESSI